ncbi:hypothetical protein C7S18_13315 [Ahniella affigens]|uniref:histidine kinase n=1 Tax=Ahniella affigens TaxID=2021234 RepID=A0A2P1PTF0_9GAMM|nr:sensor histidine kinase [Ahniella affigens]AVP98116.1 hypothetical protein C7S18_13315 [Ahniella affigens]
MDPRGLARWGLSLLLLLSTEALALDRNQVRFRSFNIDRGLSSSTARDLVQDATGQIWIGTQDGLNRYDGYGFTVFAHDPDDPHSISADHVTSLAATDASSLWVGTVAGGLNQLNLASGRFVRLQAGAKGPLLSNNVSDLLVDRHGDLWVATVDGGLQRRDRDSGAFVTLAYDNACMQRIRTMVELANGDLLIACDGQLLKRDGTSGAINQWPDPALNNWPKGLTPVALAELPNGRIMVGDARLGLWEFAPDGVLFARHQHHDEQPDSLVHDQITRMLVTRTGELWVGTFDGLSYYRGSGQFLNFRHDAANNASLPANRIPSLLEDRQGQIWVGTWTAGFAVHNPATRALRLVRHRQDDATSLPSNPVRALHRESDGSLWLGLFEGGGLVQLDPDLNVVKHFQHRAQDPRSLPDNNVQAVMKDTEGAIWVATVAGGVGRMPAGSPDFETFVGTGQGLDSTGARALMQTHDQAIWVGTDDAGVKVRCRTCPAFQPLSEMLGSHDTGLDRSFINVMFEDRRHRVWIGLNGTGLARIDPARQTMTRFRADANDPGALPSDVVTDVHETASGTIWIATQGSGVAEVIETDPAETPRFRAIGKREGLSASAVGSLLEDARGKIWVASIVGIDELDPVTGKIRNLQASDGFDRSGYFISAKALDPDGRVFFGGLVGLVAFHPKDFRPSELAPSVTLTDVQTVSGLARRADARQRMHAAFLDELVLQPDETDWAVSFSTMDFLGPETTRYQYRLLGLSEQWLSLPRSQHSASFTHVPAGHYTFEVRAQAANSLDFGPATGLPVTVLSPWWQRPWALLLYALTALAVILIMSRRFRRNLAERARQQAAIAANERRLNLSLWGSRDELWDYDVQNAYVRRDNPLPGLFASELTLGGPTQLFLAAVHPDDRDALNQALRAHIRGQSEFLEVSFRARGANGDWIWLLQRGKAVARDANGRATHLIGTTRDITSIKRVEEALRLSNEQLEARVNERTHALTEANRELRHAMSRLQDTQSQLIESEKLASLGGLVAGVAHEINTPLGICLTAASHLKQATEQLQEARSRGDMTRSALERYEQNAIEAARLILKNLERAVQLVRSFKQVAVDQGSEERRTINLGQYLDEVAFALKPMLKRTPHQLAILCPEDIVIDTYPGAIYQIVVNFVSNSLAHAFAEGQPGLLRLSVQPLPGQRLQIEYADNGVGASADVLKRIFEPFFTTRRGSGGSGLGMHIVYNLVTKLLNGSISVENVPGLRFRMVMPMAPPSS